MMEKGAGSLLNRPLFLLEPPGGRCSLFFHDLLRKRNGTPGDGEDINARGQVAEAGVDVEGVDAGAGAL
jgi:hypothetical protein